MSDRRVAVTGLGLVTPAAVGTDETFEAFLTGSSFLRTIDLFDAGGFSCSFGGQLQEKFSARKFVPKSYRKSVKVMARDIEIAVAAADLAFRDAGFRTRGVEEGQTEIAAKRSGCNIGAGLICADLDELGFAAVTAVRDGKFNLKAWGEEGMNNLTPLWLLKYLPNMLSCHVTIIHGLEGPSNCITCGDVSGYLSAIESANWVKENNADVAIVGGAESKMNQMGLLRQGMLGRLIRTTGAEPTTALRPFDADHDGTAVGEGGGMAILEDMSGAENRGARIYCEYLAGAGACDPQGMMVENRESVGNLDIAASKALKKANLRPDEVDLVVTQGTGVPQEDNAEIAAWNRVFADRSEPVAAVSSRGAFGQLFAGTSGVDFGLAAKALETQIVPPTANFSAPAVQSKLQFRPEAGAAEINIVLCGGYSIGGQSGAIVLKRYSK
ncbi:MAG: beta-ketoacyl-[acyl-carrier-protein] synthase family protein [Phycisphaerae bacterium]